MNKLSWFLYLADIVPDMLLPILVPITLLGILISPMVFIGVIWLANENEGTYAKDRAEAYYNRVVYHAKWIIPLFLIIHTLNVLIPSRETIYLIAGSEVGEVVANSPEAKEILNDVKAVIKEQLKGMRNER